MNFSFFPPFFLTASLIFLLLAYFLLKFIPAPEKSSKRFEILVWFGCGLFMYSVGHSPQLTCDRKDVKGIVYLMLGE